MAACRRASESRRRAAFVIWHQSDAEHDTGQGLPRGKRSLGRHALGAGAALLRVVDGQRRDGGRERASTQGDFQAVSYTHLTLPTNREV